MNQRLRRTESVGIEVMHFYIQLYEIDNESKTESVGMEVIALLQQTEEK